MFINYWLLAIAISAFMGGIVALIFFWTIGRSKESKNPEYLTLDDMAIGERTKDPNKVYNRLMFIQDIAKNCGYRLADHNPQMGRITFIKYIFDDVKIELLIFIKNDLRVQLQINDKEINESPLIIKKGNGGSEADQIATIMGKDNPESEIINRSIKQSIQL